MAKTQTRRTVSMNHHTLVKLKAYAAKERLPVAALAEFWLLQNLAAPLNRRAFDKWLLSRAAMLHELAVKGGRMSAGNARLTPRRKPSTWLARRAAEHCLEHGGEAASAARAFGVTRQAVHQQLAKLRRRAATA